MNKRYYEHTLSTTREFIEYLRTIHYSEPVAKLNIYFLLFAEVALLFLSGNTKTVL